MMDKDHKEKLEMEEHVPAPKRVYITFEVLVSDSQRDVPGACRCSKGRRDKRTQKTAKDGLKRSLKGGQSCREGNETNEVESRGRTDGCAKNKKTRTTRTTGTTGPTRPTGGDHRRRPQEETTGGDNRKNNGKNNRKNKNRDKKQQEQEKNKKFEQQPHRGTGIKFEQ